MSAPTTDRPWPDTSELGFWNIARQEPDRAALLLDDASSVSFGGLYAEANRIARVFRAAGLTRGDCVATVLPNDLSAYAAELAA